MGTSDQDRKFRIRSTANPMAIALPSRRDPKAPETVAAPTLELEGVGTRPHPKLAGRKPSELITAAERAELERRPELAKALADGRLIIEAAA